VETELYKLRFSDAELSQARRFWRPICGYLQRYVPAAGTTLDLGAGYCHFINAIESREKIALDINEQALRKYASGDVRRVAGSGADLGEIATDSVDTVFASNVYEHFPSREDVLRSFHEVRRVLKTGGRFIIMQPNFTYCWRSYFDFFDHVLVFTRAGMTEGLKAAGFHMEIERDRFLPYTSKGRLPKATWLVAAYLKVPIAWRFFGAQMLLVAVKRR
jgi:SAM-dependent methyltransferase